MKKFDYKFVTIVAAILLLVWVVTRSNVQGFSGSNINSLTPPGFIGSTINSFTL